MLIGVGASAISRFPKGYSQNAAATSAHVGAIRDGRFATARGHVFAGDDLLRGRIIEALMCDFTVRTGDLGRRFGLHPDTALQMFERVNARFDGLLGVTPDGLTIPEDLRVLTRLVARAFDAYDMTGARHSSAI